MSRVSSLSVATYDNNGNTLTDASGKSHTWDFENRLVSAVVPWTGTVTFKYDPFGGRFQKSSPLGTTNYLYDGMDVGANVIEEVDNSGSTLTRYTQSDAIDQPLAILRGGATSYYHGDGLGSITSLTSTAGSLANTYSYDSFGKLSASTGGVNNPFQYTGRDNDTENGLRYYRARYYDPNVGRFLSEDPMRWTGGLDFYAYATNNPLTWTDPFGLMVGDEAVTIVLDIGFYASCAEAQKREFQPFSGKGHPRYAHCMASCYLVKRCGGTGLAWSAGITKEFQDLYTCIKTGSRASCNTAFQPSDLRDNTLGRACPKNRSCEDQCQGLRNEPDAPPGPFYRRPFLR